MSLTLRVAPERFALRGVFRIARGARTHAEVVAVVLSDGAHEGRGECLPYARYGESLEGVIAAITDLAPALADGLDRAGLQTALPAGAARNALDCAFWDLEAKRAGAPAWALAGMAPPQPVATVYTLSIDAPEAMRDAAAAQADRPALKVKLGGEGGHEADLARLRAVRAGAPAARLVVDANEGWTATDYAALAPALAELGVAMVEQPLPAGLDAALATAPRPVPVCADEACHDRASLAALAGKYDMVNLKLDKTGGLTEALATRAAAEAMGFEVMVGCMMATSLAMAPAHLLAQGAALADLDAPLWLAEDRDPPMAYQGSLAQPAPAQLWG